MVIIIIISSYEETEQTHIVQPSTEADLWTAICSWKDDASPSVLCALEEDI